MEAQQNFRSCFHPNFQQVSHCFGFDQCTVVDFQTFFKFFKIHPKIKKQGNVCSIKFRSKHSTGLLLCLLQNLMEQTLVTVLESNKT